MRKFLAATLLLAGTVLTSCAVDPVGTSSLTGADAAGSAVRIETATGLGSGVYIGNGLILTAAHVVADATHCQRRSFDSFTAKVCDPSFPAYVTLRSDVGDIQQGEVLWLNKQYDIAAVRPANPRRFSASALACRPVEMGEQITAEGNPFGLQFITMHGYAAGAVTEYAPNWKSAFITDISMASGMSGGGVYDAYGDVIGIGVGVVDPHGGPQGSTSGFAFVVPSSEICRLLGRA